MGGTRRRLAELLLLLGEAVHSGLFVLGFWSFFTNTPYLVYLSIYVVEEELAALKHCTELHSLLEPFIYRIERTRIVKYLTLPPNPSDVHTPVQHLISSKV